MIKVTKTQVKALAKKHNSIEVTMFPSNCGPANTTWVQGYENTVYITPDKKGFYMVGMNGDDATFDDQINSFMYYNCDSELGNRVHYYVKGES